ncbi:MAG: DUF3488 and transglutaminase-like domain-containing protein [Pseudomonadota bacterium]
MKFTLLQILPASLLLSILPFFTAIAWPILAFNVLILVWAIISRQLIYIRLFKQTRIQWLIKFALISINLLMIAKFYGFHLTQNISIVLLISMLCLKLLEINNEQDKRNIAIIIYLQFFLVACSFLSSQGILISLYNIFLVLWLNFVMMIFSRLPLHFDKQSLSALFTNKGNYLKIRHLIKVNLKIALIAIPLTIALFILFPRIPGPLWTLPNLSSQSTTGLSDTMYPGSVSDLSDSAEIVFRIDFKGSIPQASRLYWRGPVLSKTDGLLWEQNEQADEKLTGRFSQRISQTDQATDYTITLEPQKQKWLFTLEMAQAIKSQFVSDAYLSNNMQFLVKHAISRVVQYQVRSYTSFTFKASNQLELNQALIYSGDSNPKTRQLGLLWKKNIKQAEKIIQKGLNYFVEKDFYYTRKPSLMLKNPADEFLFEYKRGFCEHFASSFVLLMRAAGIPARVVTGYQGMEYNKVGDYYLVRQSNAHAWAEVWLKDKGWIRVDPTAVIPQDHIEADIFDYKKDEMGFLNLNYSDLQQLALQLKGQVWSGNLIKQFKQSLDMLQYSWNNWVLSYDQNKQQWLLALFGFKNNWQVLAILLVIIPFLMVGLIYYFQLIKKQPDKDKLIVIYQKFLVKLQNQGLQLSSHSGPQALKIQSIKKFPQQAKQLQFIFNYYIQLRYARASDVYSIKQFKKLTRQFRLIRD